MREQASYVLEQGDIRLVVTGALGAESPIAEHVRRHGDGVHDLAWLVDDADAAFAAAVVRGARPDPRALDRAGRARRAATRTGRRIRRHRAHVRRRSRYRSELLEPGYHDDNLPNPTVGPVVGLTRIDHVVGNVEQGRLDDWVRFYAEVIGLRASCTTSTTTRSRPSTRR